MLKRQLIALALVAAFGAAHAQNAPAPASPAKKELVARILKIQQPGIDGMARGLVEQTAGQLMEGAFNVIGAKFAPDKQEAMANEVRNDLKKFVDDTAPIVQKRASELAPTTVGALLEERFSEDELRQITTALESPAFQKFQRLGDDMQRSLAEKLVADTRPQVEPKVRAIQAQLGKKLGVDPNAPAAAAPANKPAAGKAPAKKQ